MLRAVVTASVMNRAKCSIKLLLEKKACTIIRCEPKKNSLFVLSLLFFKCSLKLFKTVIIPSHFVFLYSPFNFLVTNIQ